MQTTERIKPGDFSNLAKMYSKYRPGYSTTVLDALLGIIQKPVNQIDFVDVGAGTGIWTRLVAERGCHAVTAIEPNDAMRTEGIHDSRHTQIIWQAGSAENTHLLAECADMVSMASSFHWANFEIATKEFHRILKPHGHFVALWNPRYLDDNSLLLEIENYIYQLQPDMKRVSSGKSKHIDDLAKKMESSPLFENLTYLEAKHTAAIKKEDYMGVWKSVNDVRSQLGEAKFQEFLDFVADKLQSHTVINCSYLTRAWVMRKR